MRVHKIAIFGPKAGVDNRAVKMFVKKVGSDVSLITLAHRGVPVWVKEQADKESVRCVQIRPNRKKYGSGAFQHSIREAVMAAHEVVVFYGESVDQYEVENHIPESAIKKALEWQRPLAVFGPEGQVLRYIEQYDPPPKMATSLRGPDKLPGPAQGPVHVGRVERRTRRKEEARARRQARKIKGRLESQGIQIVERRTRG